MELMVKLAAQRRNGIMSSISTLVEPEDFEVTFTEEEERRLHNWCAVRGLIIADEDRAKRGGSKGGITRRSQRGMAKENSLGRTGVLV